MKDLITALQIMNKYGNPDYPTICVHDALYITHEIKPDEVSAEDVKKLHELGFFITDEFGSDNKQFKSHKYGSA